MPATGHIGSHNVAIRPYLRYTFPHPFKVKTPFRRVERYISRNIAMAIFHSKLRLGGQTDGQAHHV